jgi:hypothetical protein
VCCLIIRKKRKVRKEKIKKKKGYDGYGWFGGLFCNIYPVIGFFRDSGVRGGGKCPEEEHTTCSGGPTINCHKRGLRGRENLG